MFLLVKCTDFVWFSWCRTLWDTGSEKSPTLGVNKEFHHTSGDTQRKMDSCAAPVLVEGMRVCSRTSKVSGKMCHIMPMTFGSRLGPIHAGNGFLMILVNQQTSGAFFVAKYSCLPVKTTQPRHKTYCPSQPPLSDCPKRVSCSRSNQPATKHRPFSSVPRLHRVVLRVSCANRRISWQTSSAARRSPCPARSRSRSVVATGAGPVLQSEEMYRCDQ